MIRFLKFKGYSVTYTQNVTDINDRDKDILQRAKDQNIPWNKLTDFWTKKFLDDMQKLNWTHPAYYLKASEQIPAVINLIKKLLKNDLAYQTNGSVYLDVSKNPDYGKLSKFSRPKMLKVAKDFEEDLENPDKIDPLDITLWKATSKNQPTHIPSFESPFGTGRPAQEGRGSPGDGRPGWHIECSAMSIKTLGEQIDIHGGGKDLIFPHHEAEIAQSEGATKKIPFAKYWIHSGTVAYDGAKMSKSKGNLVMVSSLLKKYSGNAIRYLLLSNHWQSSWEYKEADLKKAQEKVEFIENAIVSQGPLRRLIEASPLRLVKDEASTLLGAKQSESTKRFRNIMDNNLDTPKALQFLNTLAKNNNSNKLKKYYQLLGFKI